MTLTKERLEQFINKPLEYGLTRGEQMEMARITLAALTADPVVPDELLSAMEDVLRISDRDHDAWHKVKAGIVSCRAAMLQGAAGNSPAIPDGWVACSERMPDEDGNYWGWWSESKRQGPVWFIKSDLQAQFQSSEITHWMPLPAAPRQEAK